MIYSAQSCRVDGKPTKISIQKLPYTMRFCRRQVCITKINVVITGMCNRANICSLFCHNDETRGRLHFEGNLLFTHYGEIDAPDRR